MKHKIILVLVVFLIPFNTFALSVSSRNAVLMDTDSGRVLYEKKKDSSSLIASTTKIMTAILAIESGKLDEIVTIGDEVLTMYGSNIYIEPGEELLLKDLVYGLMLRSGNDAAVSISKFVSGDEEKFVKLMNKKASEIGMKNTIYSNPHGLDEVSQNKSTAYDLAILSSYAIKNKIYREIVSTKKYNVETNKKSYIWYNRNELLKSYKYCIGGKTGYTPSAGKVLVTNSKKGDFNLTVVTINDGNQYITHKELYDYGFDNYKKYLILDKKNIKIEDNFFSDKLYIKNDFYYPLSEEEKDNISIIMKIDNNKNYRDNDKIGIIRVKLYDDIIFEDNVYVKLEKKINNNIFKKIISIFGK